MIELAVCLVLVWVIVDDLRHFRIRNWVVGLLVAAFLLAVIVGRMPSAVATWHLIFALAVLALLFLVFLARGIGGGDAKLLAAALLWIGPEGAFVFSLVLLVGAVVTIAAAKLRWLPSRQKDDRMVIPFGPSIAVGWIAVIILSAYIGAIY